MHFILLSPTRLPWAFKNVTQPLFFTDLQNIGRGLAQTLLLIITFEQMDNKKATNTTGNTKTYKTPIESGITSHLLIQTTKEIITDLSMKNEEDVI